MKQPASPRVEKELWRGRPTWWTALRKFLTEDYTLTSERLKINYGLLSKHAEEIELFRVKDLSVQRSLWDRMFGVGNIVLSSGDTTSAVTILHDIRNAEAVKDIIRDASRVERQRNRVGVFEETSIDGLIDPQ